MVDYPLLSPSNPINQRIKKKDDFFETVFFELSR